jgi:hypothetical protein
VALSNDSPGYKLVTRFYGELKYHYSDAGFFTLLDVDLKQRFTDDTYRIFRHSHLAIIQEFSVLAYRRSDLHTKFRMN